MMRRLSLALLARASCHYPIELAIGLASSAPQCAGGWTVLELSIKDCAGLKGLTAPLREDVHLSVDGVDSIICDSTTTVMVQGPYELRVSSSGPSFRFSNVRFVVEDGAMLTVDLDGEGPATASSTPLIFDGISHHASNGGILDVSRGGLATFFLPVYFEDNSVADGFSGGAIHVEGMVSFEHAAHFKGNRAIGTRGASGDVISCGGGVAVGSGGRVVFSEFTSFEENSAELGGGLCNNGGSVEFQRRSFFSANSAYASGGKEAMQGGGDGGAVYGGYHAETIFRRKSTMLRNTAENSGGALYNAGRCNFETAAAFQGNEAMGDPSEEDRPSGGGHVFNRGSLHIKGDASFREGYSRSNGGAVYTMDGRRTRLAGITSFVDNTAEGECNALYSSLSDGEVQLTTTVHRNPAGGSAGGMSATELGIDRRRTASSNANPPARATPCQPSA